MTRIKLHVGYGIAAIGYMAAIGLLSSGHIRNPLPELVSTLLHIPLFASLTLCLLLSASAGQWDRLVSPRTYWLIGLVAAIYGVLIDSYQYLQGKLDASGGDVLVDGVGIAALLIFHRMTHQHGPEMVRETSWKGGDLI